MDYGPDESPSTDEPELAHDKSCFEAWRSDAHDAWIQDAGRIVNAKRLAALVASLDAEEPAVPLTADELRTLLTKHRPAVICTDTEFAGGKRGDWNTFDIRAHSPVHAVTPYIISLAFFGCEDGIVLDVTDDPAPAYVLYSYIKVRRPLIVAHNAPVDYHAMVNDGLDPDVDLLDSLQCCRWFFPSYESFGLDALYSMHFGSGKSVTWNEIFQAKFAFTYTYMKTTVVKACNCGVAKCRKRSAGHEKYEVYGNEAKPQRGRYSHTLTPSEVKRLHPAAWQAFLNYARRDASMLYRIYTDLLLPKVNTPAVAVPRVTYDGAPARI